MWRMESTTNNQECEDIYPPKPIKPLESECCGTGCTPCVFDIYEKQCKTWNLQCDAIRKGKYCQLPNSTGDTTFISPEKYKALKILSISQETETMKMFRFFWALGGSTEFPVKIGQHLLLKYKGVSRQYTVLRTDPEVQCFDILIKIYPISSNEECETGREMLTPQLDCDGLLLGASDAETIIARGPFGQIYNYVPNTISTLVLLAAGTGIAPMFRIIQSILNNEDDQARIKLLFSCPNLKDIPLLGYFKAWSSFWNFDITYFIPLSREENEEGRSLPYYKMKIVNHRLNFDHLSEQIKIINGFKLESSMFLICGTKSFEKDMINYLSKIGVDSNQLKCF